ncbi:MAG: hypothetical protein JSS22_01335 [Proteobacteria bacterium]|nr:hypothetical protein [Pseudomonadota bacterium]
MKKAKTKAPARKAAKTSRPATKAKLPARPAAKAASRSPGKPAATRSKAGKAAAAVKTGAKTGAKPASRTVEAVAPRATGKPVTPTTPRKALTLPVKPVAIAPTQAPAVAPMPPKPAHPAPKPASNAAPRADVPPETGFTLLVDGHFKSQFETLAQATQAATELKTRFPILRVEVYDAAKKTRLAV